MYLLMKKVFFLLLFILYFFPSFSYSQYGIVFNDSLGKPFKNQKKHLLSFLTEQMFFKYQDKRGKIALDITLTEREDEAYLPDSIHGIFKINNIIEKKDNFVKKGNKLAKQTIFLIDIENIDTMEKYPQYIRLISVEIDNGVENKQKKIEIGQEYEMTIYSFFEKDCCRPIEEDGNIIYLTRKPNEQMTSIFFEDIWVVFIDISSYNMFETPNIKGLYYISNK